MLKGKRLLSILTGLAISLYMMYGISLDTVAVGKKEYLDSLSAGVSNAISTNEDSNEGETEEQAEEKVDSGVKSDLVMADVKAALNVRAEASLMQVRNDVLRAHSKGAKRAA